MNREIGKIKKTLLGYEGHGILSAYLVMDFGGAGQSIGGYGLDEYDKEKERRVGHAACGVFVAGVLRACGVDSWEQVAGRTVFVLRDGPEGVLGGRALGIAPLPTEPGEEFLFSEIEDTA